MAHSNRRAFLADVGQAMLVAGIGSSLAADLGVSVAVADEAAPALTFGPRERLAALLQETALEKLLPVLAGEIRNGTTLPELLAAGALANARSFGGEDYIGFHTFMALLPAGQMARELPQHEAALPVLKVLYRNTARIHATGGRDHEVLHWLEAGHDHATPQHLHAATRAGDTAAAEQAFATLLETSPLDAYNAIQPAVEDETDVHRVVLAWRAWSTLDLTGSEHAQTLLRQSVRYCCNIERQIQQRGGQTSAVRDVLPRLLDQYRLLERPMGQRSADDAWLNAFAQTMYSGTREQAAAAAAAALADGFSPAAIGEAISLAATRLVLFDPGREEKYSSAEKPPGCVHGDSVGVHASDAANAWRSIAAVCNSRNSVASLILAAYHTAGQSGRSRDVAVGLDLQDNRLQTLDAAAIRGELETAIVGKEQARAAALVRQYGVIDGPARPLFDQLLQHSVRSDGALHAEKYYYTVSQEFARTRPAFRWEHLTALARVVASESGHIAPGYQESRELLSLKT